MSLEVLSTAAAIGTFLVIAATAVAALIQLRHMRSGNEIIAVTEFRETYESAHFNDAGKNWKKSSARSMTQECALI